MRAHVIASALLLSVPVFACANEPLTMVVTPVQSFAPSNLTIRIRVEPDPANRSLEVVAESDDYYRSSHIQLDGASAPRTILLEFRNLSGGSYEVRGALVDTGGRERAAARKQVFVLGSADRE